MDNRVASISWLLRIILQWAWKCRVLQYSISDKTQLTYSIVKIEGFFFQVQEFCKDAHSHLLPWLLFNVLLEALITAFWQDHITIFIVFLHLVSSSTVWKLWLSVSGIQLYIAQFYNACRIVLFLLQKIKFTQNSKILHYFVFLVIWFVFTWKKVKVIFLYLFNLRIPHYWLH